MKKHNVIIVMIIAAFAIFASLSLVTSPSEVKAETIKTKADAQSFLIENGLTMANKSLPPFSVQDGKTKAPVSLPNDNKPALVHIWATWCGPCKIELPDFDKAAPSFTNAGIDVFCVVSGNDSKADHSVDGLKKFYKDKHINHLPMHIDVDRSLINYLKVMSYPSTYLVKSGRIVAYFQRPITWSKNMIHAIKIFMTA